MKGNSIEGIYETVRNCAMISKTAGGIGLSIHCIRATGFVFFFPPSVYIKGRLLGRTLPEPTVTQAESCRWGQLQQKDNSVNNFRN